MQKPQHGNLLFTPPSNASTSPSNSVLRMARLPFLHLDNSTINCSRPSNRTINLASAFTNVGVLERFHIGDAGGAENFFRDQNWIHRQTPFYQPLPYDVLRDPARRPYNAAPVELRNSSLFAKVSGLIEKSNNRCVVVNAMGAMPSAVFKRPWSRETRTSRARPT